MRPWKPQRGQERESFPDGRPTAALGVTIVGPVPLHSSLPLPTLAPCRLSLSLRVCTFRTAFLFCYMNV